MNQNLRVISNLLNDFSNFIDNRTTFFWHYSKEVFFQILDWHFRVWCKEQFYRSQKKNYSVSNQYFQVGYILNSIIRKIEETALKPEEDSLFFECFKEHIEKLKEHYIEVNGAKHYYVEDSLKTFYKILFETVVGFSMRLYIWHDWFPHEWRVTKNNLDKERIAKISQDRFLAWAQERIENTKEEYDKQLDVVVENLFPDVEPAVWAKILIFVFSPYGESKLRSVIERPWNFGYSITRSYSDSPEIMKLEMEKEKRNTFELALLIFKDQFSKENLKKYMEELGKLEYLKDSIEERKRMSLLNIFSGMLEFLNQQTKPANE